jgi:hypothetical protein
MKAKNEKDFFRHKEIKYTLRADKMHIIPVKILWQGL